MTRWAKKVTPETVHQEYPRPQMVRKGWLNLNGLWQYAIVLKDAPQPKMDGQILVPFPVEAALSGVGKTVGKDNRLWYRRTFALPKDEAGQRVLLNFGAVDWEAAIWVNGQKVGEHTGGYDPFSFDVTHALKKNAKEQEIVVSVWDPTDEGTQPRGKQVNKPHGIWYTPVTGIWQTVWLEVVPLNYIKSLHMVPDIDRNELTVTVTVGGGNQSKVKVSVPQLKQTQTGKSGEPIKLKLADYELWSPGNPKLYDLSI